MVTFYHCFPIFKTNQLLLVVGQKKIDEEIENFMTIFEIWFWRFWHVNRVLLFKNEKERDCQWSGIKVRIADKIEVLFIITVSSDLSFISSKFFHEGNDLLYPR